MVFANRVPVGFADCCVPNISRIVPTRDPTGSPSLRAVLALVYRFGDFERSDPVDHFAGSVVALSGGGASRDHFVVQRFDFWNHVVDAVIRGFFSASFRQIPS